MPGPLASVPVLLAQAPARGEGGLLPTLIMFAPVVLLFYLMILRPQTQERRKREAMIQALKKNDRVLTTAGIYGTVVAVDHEANRVVLRVDDDRGVKMTFSKDGIFRVLEPAEAKPAGVAEV